AGRGAGAAGAQAFKAPTAIDSSGLRGPVQPVFYRHDIHAGERQIPCAYCHYTADRSSEPGIPSLETCFGCHQLIPGSTPENQAEIRKVVTARLENRPIEWVRVHRLPDFVQFPHSRHVKALGYTPEGCAACHGTIAEMPRVYQVSTLKMGWCVSCHEQRNVTRDCTVCHY
ncbi:MAG: cytochrome c3 family protein, partial [Gemmatimonadales bacterium]